MKRALTASQEPEQVASLLITNLSIRAEDAFNWFQSDYSRYQSKAAPDMVRTVWTNPENADDRVIIDVYEAESAPHAKEFLSLLLSRCAVMPVVIGDGDSDTPKRNLAKDTQFVLVGNLVIGILRFGVFKTLLDPWSAHLNARAREKPEHFLPELNMSLEEFSEEGVRFARILYKAPPDFEEPYELKFYTEDGELSRREKDLILRPSHPGHVSVEGFALRGDGKGIRGSAELP